MVKAAKVEIDSYWASLFAKLVERRSVDDLITNVGSGGGGAPVCAVAPAGGAPAAAAAPVVEEKKVRCQLLLWIWLSWIYIRWN